MLSQKLNSGQPWPLNQVQGPEQFTGILLRYYFPVIEIKGYAMIEKIKLGTIIILFSVIMSPLSVLGQSHGNHADHGDHGHAHMGPAVSCTNMANPPWNGLSEKDKQRFSNLHQDLSGLNTPESAIAAGFFPALGDIPGMGIHYVNLSMGLDKDYNIDLPNQLLFSPIDGEEKLVGAAYAFVDVPDTDVQLPFESEFASWHDHPQFANDGETLHMLHVWFVDSSNGPFAGLNFWLPYRTADIEIPNPCWMEEEEIADRIRKVSFALTQFDWEGSESDLSGQGSEARPSSDEIQGISDSTGVDGEVVEAIVTTDGAAGASWNRPPSISSDRLEMLEVLGAAAQDDDIDAWRIAADTFLADLNEEEMNRVFATLGVLGENQMSSAERDAAGISQPGSRN